MLDAVPARVGHPDSSSHVRACIPVARTIIVEDIHKPSGVAQDTAKSVSIADAVLHGTDVTNIDAALEIVVSNAVGYPAAQKSFDAMLIVEIGSAMRGHAGGP